MRKVYSSDSILRASSRFKKLAEDKSSEMSDSDKFQLANRCSDKNKLFLEFKDNCSDKLRVIQSDISLLAFRFEKDETKILAYIDKLIRFCEDDYNENGLLWKINKLIGPVDGDGVESNKFSKIHECLDKYDQSLSEIAYIKDSIKEANLSAYQIRSVLKDMQEAVKAKFKR